MEMPQQLPPVVVCLDQSNPQTLQRDKALAQQLGLQCVDTSDQPQGLYIGYWQQRLCIKDGSNKNYKPFYIDFEKLLNTLSTRDKSKKQPLARAIGIKTRTVLDVTAGLGQDACLLAAIGYSVTAIERSAIIYALLADAWSRLQQNETLLQSLVGSLQFIHADARQFCNEIKSGKPPDTIYMDPMYPPKRKKSALTRKSMRILRQLVGEDVDAAALCRQAQELATKRVVVKRPNHAEPLLPDPDTSFAGKMVRYDVYLKH